MELTQPISIAEYVAIINGALKQLHAVVVGEVSELKVAASGHAYFTLKDKQSGDTLPCAMWKFRYSTCGVQLEVGMEVRVSGEPNYKGEYGKLTFIAETVALVGEGALLKAYQLLKKKLAAEGLFDVARKRSLPQYIRTIGVITSVHGAVIHDFSNNLRKSGFHVRILDARVEGPECGSGLALSVRAMRNEAIDVLVLIRGGGSIQSLAGFDNESLVREIARFPVPVLVGVGHHQDVTLAALVADVQESTPSIVAALLGRAWDQASAHLARHERAIVSTYGATLRNASLLIASTCDVGLAKIEQQIVQSRRLMLGNAREILGALAGAITNVSTRITAVTRLIDSNSPERQLQLGYSIARVDSIVIRSVRDVQPGATLHVQVADGELISEIKSL